MTALVYVVAPNASRSPSLDLIRALRANGLVVESSAPHFWQSEPLAEANRQRIGQADLVVVALVGSLPMAKEFVSEAEFVLRSAPGKLYLWNPSKFRIAGIEPEATSTALPLSHLLAPAVRVVASALDPEYPAREEAARRRLRSFRLGFFCVMVLYLPTFVAWTRLTPLSPPYSFVFLFLFAPLFCWTSYYSTVFRCPRCSAKFRTDFRRTCPDCFLEIL